MEHGATIQRPRIGRVWMATEPYLQYCVHGKLVIQTSHLHTKRRYSDSYSIQQTPLRRKYSHSQSFVCIYLRLANLAQSISDPDQIRIIFTDKSYKSLTRPRNRHQASKLGLVAGDRFFLLPPIISDDIQNIFYGLGAARTNEQQHITTLLYIRCASYTNTWTSVRRPYKRNTFNSNETNKNDYAGYFYLFCLSPTSCILLRLRMCASSAVSDALL